MAQGTQDHRNNGFDLLGLIPHQRVSRFVVERPDAEVIERFAQLEDATGTLSDILDGLGLAGAIGTKSLKPILAGKAAVGPAVTLRYAPNRQASNLAAADKGAISMAEIELYRIAQPGDVVVIDAGGLDVSCMGGMSASTAVAHGMAAVVAWGGVRDVRTIAKAELPTWAASVTPWTGKFRLEAVEINGPINVAGVQVRPGDIVAADDTGVVVVPQGRVAEVLNRAEQVMVDEFRIRQLLVRGASRDELSAVWGRLRARLEADRMQSNQGETDDH